jgi:hypothetical protein
MINSYWVTDKNEEENNNLPIKREGGVRVCFFMQRRIVW